MHRHDETSHALNNQELLMASLNTFFKQKEHIDVFLSIVNGNSRISLRLIDWFVTNYSKKFNVIITQKQEDRVEYFNVYLNYRSQLKAFSKGLFDPFRRRERLQYEYEKGKFVTTTIGQLAFFRWAIENNIIDYLNDKNNITKVEKDISKTQKDNHVTTKNVVSKVLTTDDGCSTVIYRKKRNTLSSCTSKNMTTYTGKLVVTFD
jgi:hypothetical protein